LRNETEDELKLKINKNTLERDGLSLSVTMDGRAERMNDS